MKKQNSILICLCLLAVFSLVAAIYSYIDYKSVTSSISTPKGTVVELSEDEHTHGIVVFVEEELDTLMLGKWQHASDTTWYRIFTTEPAGDDFYWGREWNEAEDIYEEDLTPYGNGWFKWKKTNKDVIEWHVADNNAASIPFEYKMLDLNAEAMYFKEKRDGDKQLFRKCVW